MYGIDGSQNSRTSCKTSENIVKCQKYNTSFIYSKNLQIGVYRADFGPRALCLTLLRQHKWPWLQSREPAGIFPPTWGRCTSCLTLHVPGCYVTTFHRIRCNSVEKRKGVLLAAHRNSKLNEKWNKVHLCVSISNPAAELQRVL